MVKIGCNCEGCAEGKFWLPRRRFLTAGLGLAVAGVAHPARATPSGDVYRDFWSSPRAIRVYRKQTGESGTYEYWRDGRIQLDAWYSLLHLLRDVRGGATMHYDPTVIDVVWGVQEWARRDLGKNLAFRITDGARLESTNQATSGAASNSQHKQGRAIDGRLEGITLDTYAKAARFFQLGGVGLYSTHVHVDSGEIRKWGM